MGGPLATLSVVLIAGLVVVGLFVTYVLPAIASVTSVIETIGR